jgi:phytoene desaturase
MNKVLIVGTGLGGISTAIRLAKKGYKVEMLEQYHQPGGRLNQIKQDGFTFDTGPTFFSMSYEFREFMKDTGIEMPFRFVELDPLYAVNFISDGRTFRIYKDPVKMAAQFKDIEPDFEAKLERYLKSAGSFFHDTIDSIVKRNFDSLPEYLWAMMQVPPKHVPKLFRNVWQEVSRYFDSQEARQILSLVAFFLGATPFDTPGVYTLLSYTELVHDGYYNVEGGMYKIVEGLQKEMDKLGVRTHYNTEVTSYLGNGKVLEGLVDKSGKVWKSDIYVVNADAAVFRGKVFNRPAFSEEKLDKQKWTFAPLTIYLGVKGKIDQLHHHHYFLGNNFEEYARKIFKEKEMSDRPYYYVNVLSRSNPECAPEGCESLIIVVPVSDLRYKSNWDDKEAFAMRLIDDLSKRTGFDIKSNLLTHRVMSPQDWANSFNLHRGSGLGLTHDLTQIGAFRPKNQDEKFKNVYYVGASTTPGTGLPMVVISSKLATERILKNHGTI